MRIRNFIYSFILLLFFVSHTDAQPEGKISIALIVDNGLSSLPLVSLLEVELSQREDIQLLERAAIDKILEEQKLSAAGLLDRNNTIKIGKLLRADAFIIISKEKSTPDSNNVSLNLTSGDLIRVRVSETAHGLRLLDYFAQSDSNSVGSIVQKLEIVLNKINQPDEKLIPVGIVDIHRVQLAEKYKMLERTLPVLLSVRLNLEPQIIMLEREDLKVLLDEKLMTEGEDTKFWSSAILIDGYIQPNSGQLELHLNLKQAAGKNLKSFIVPVEPNEPSKAIVKATTEITKQLQNSSPAAKWNPEQEAEQFYKKGKMLEYHSRNEEALSLFETAHALQPQNIQYTKTLFLRIWEMRQEIERVILENESRIQAAKEQQKNNPEISDLYIMGLEEHGVCPYSDIEIAELATILVRQIKDSVINGQITPEDIFSDMPSCLGLSIEDVYGYFASSVSASNEKVRLINRENRENWVKVIELATTSSSYKYQLMAKIAWLSSDDPNELILNLKNAFDKYVLSPEYDADKRWQYEREYIFNKTFKRAPDIWMLSKSYLKDSKYSVQKQWKDYLEEIAITDDPMIRLYSCLALCQIVDIPDEQEIQKSKYYTNEALKIICQQLQNPKERFNPNITVTYNNFRKALGSLDSFNIFTEAEIVDIMTKIYVPLIEKGDVETLSHCNPGNSPNKLSYLTSKKYLNDLERWYQILERISKVLEVSNEKITINALSSIRSFQAKMRKNIPDLIIEYSTFNLHINMILSQDNWLEYSYHSVPNRLNNWITYYSSQIRSISNIDNETLLIFCISPSIKQIGKDNIDIVEIDLLKKKLISIDHAQITSFKTNRLELKGLVIKQKTVYVAVSGYGIIEYSRNNSSEKGTKGKYRLLTIENGLPSLLITSIAAEGEKLWLAYGDQEHESGLGIYDPKTGQWETVYCSTLKGEPPFNAGYPYILKCITPTQSGKIFFELNQSYSLGTRRVGDFNKNWGLWGIDSSTQETKYIAPINMIQNIKEIPDNKFLIYSNTTLIEYEMDSEIFTLIYGDYLNLKKIYSSHGLSLKSLNEDLINPGTEGIRFGSYNGIDLSNCAIHNNRLWAHFGDNQIIIAEQDKEPQFYDNNILDGKPVERFVSTPYGLVGIGDGTVGLIETEE